MNVLKEARQRAGRRAATNRVLVPLVWMIALVSATIAVAPALGGELWLSALLVPITIATPLGVIVMFFAAQKNPRLVRIELDAMIRGEEVAVSMYEAAIMKFSQEVQDMKSGLHLHESRVEMSRRMRKENLVRVEKSLARLRETYEKTDDRYKIKRQEHYLALQAQIRVKEDFLQYLGDPANETPMISEKEYGDILRRARDTATMMEKKLETATAPLRQLIHESRRTVAEAKQALGQLPK